MVNAVRIRSLALLGHPHAYVPTELASLHTELRDNPARVRMNGYAQLDPLPIAEGSPWTMFEHQCLALVLTLMERICTHRSADPIMAALGGSKVRLVPLARSVEFQTGSAPTRMGGYWDAQAKRCYLDRRELAYNITSTIGTVIHEVTHALDPTLDPALYPGAKGFPLDVANRAELRAFTTQRHFHANAIEHFRGRRDLPSSFRRFQLDAHTAFRNHCDARIRLFTI